MAMAASGVGPGDEVITSAFTFLATPAAALHQNAVPVFADIDPRTYYIDPAEIEAASRRARRRSFRCTSRVAADMDRIIEIARRHGLFVIEDACQAPGALYKGKQVARSEHGHVLPEQLQEPLREGRAACSSPMSEAFLEQGDSHQVLR